MDITHVSEVWFSLLYRRSLRKKRKKVKMSTSVLVLAVEACGENFHWNGPFIHIHLCVKGLLEISIYPRAAITQINCPSFVFTLIMFRQDVNAFGHVSMRREEQGFSDYRAAKSPSVRDVHRSQTYRDSPSTFLESSVSFKNTFRAPLGKEKAPLVFPWKWNESVS